MVFGFHVSGKGKAEVKKKRVVAHVYLCVGMLWMTDAVSFYFHFLSLLIYIYC